VTLHERLLAAGRMVDDLDAQRQREDDAFTAGFRLGFHHGVDVGRGQAEQQYEQEWADFAADIQWLNRRAIPEREERRVAEAVAATERLVRSMQAAHWDKFMARKGAAA